MRSQGFLRELSSTVVPLISFLTQIMEKIGKLHLELENEVLAHIICSRHLVVKLLLLV